MWSKNSGTQPRPTYLSFHFLISKQTKLNKRMSSATHTNPIHSKSEPCGSSSKIKKKN